jgi:hypothetical protein
MLLLIVRLSVQRKFSDSRVLAQLGFAFMRLDDLVERRPRRPLLRLVTATLATCFIVGVALLGVHKWNGKTDIIAPPPPPSVDPIQTGSIPVGDAIGDMIKKSDGKAARQHR